MYRDGSTLLDEHDRAVGAIQIANGLIISCLQAAKQMSSSEHRWRVVREIQDDYSELWYQLDTARRLLAARGANTTGYDELREHVVPVLPVLELGVDTKPVDFARRAVEELRLAMPGADWNAIEARNRGLVGTSFVRRGQRIAFASVALVFTMAVATWAASSVPEERLDPRVAQRMEMKQDLADLVGERKDRIETLALLIGNRCGARGQINTAVQHHRQNVHEYVKLLVMDGQWDEAHAFGEDYKTRCGADEEVGKWARFAKKKADRQRGR